MKQRFFAYKINEDILCNCTSFINIIQKIFLRKIKNSINTKIIVLLFFSIEQRKIHASYLYSQVTLYNCHRVISNLMKRLAIISRHVSRSNGHFYLSFPWQFTSLDKMCLVQGSVFS